MINTDAEYNDLAGIDQAHTDLIYGLIVANKPLLVLEIGYGTGASSRRIQQAIEYNNNNCLYTLVDNWLDFSGNKPPDITSTLSKKINIITSTEEDFINTAYINDKYDFILSDADHHNSHKWFYKTLGLLNNHGIACFHDVTTKDFPNLGENIKYLESQGDELGYTWQVFNINTREDERCDRGLLVVFKD